MVGQLDERMIFFPCYQIAPTTILNMYPLEGAVDSLQIAVCELMPQQNVTLVITFN